MGAWKFVGADDRGYIGLVGSWFRGVMKGDMLSDAKLGMDEFGLSWGHDTNNVEMMTWAHNDGWAC